MCPISSATRRGVRAGETNDFFASTHDIASTVLAIAGREPRKPMDGTSLLPILEGGEMAVERTHWTSGLNNYVWVTDGTLQMIARNDGSNAKLYDIIADPGQTKDLASARPDDVKRLFGLVVQDAGGAPLPNYS